MTKEEYNKQVHELKQECNRKIREIQIDYAKSNNPVDIGDLITDHYHTIKVESWKIACPSFSDYPCLVYYGQQYTKSGKVAKHQMNTDMWQSNIKLINGKEI